MSLWAGFSLVGAGFVWCHSREEMLNIIGLSGMTCSKTLSALQPLMLKVTSCGSVSTLIQSVLGTVLLSGKLGESPAMVQLLSAASGCEEVMLANSSG